MNKPSLAQQLYSRHKNGAVVRSVANLALWVYTAAAYLLGFIDGTQLVCISIWVAMAVAMTAPILWLAPRMDTPMRQDVFSLSANCLEALGYTAVIYFMGGIEAAHLVVFYCILIFYVGSLAPTRFPVIVASVCVVAFSVMVTLVRLKLLPSFSDQVLASGEALMPLTALLLITIAVDLMLMLVALVAAWVGDMLRKSRQRIKEQNRLLEETVAQRTAQLQEANQALQKEIAGHQDAEKSLASSEQRYRSLVENLPSGLFIADPATGELLFLNQGAHDLLGYAAGHLEGQTIWDIVAPGEQLAIKRRFEAAMAGQPPAAQSNVHQCQRRGGALFRCEMMLTPVTHQGKKALQGIMLDVTERERLEEQIRQMQKMEAVGTLAGGIAHDFNNTLAAVMGYTELAQDDLPGDHPANRKLDLALKAAERAQDLVQQLLNFSQPGKAEKRPVLLSMAIKEDLKLLRSTLPTTIDISHSVHGEVVSVLADPAQIHQVVMNLCTNAAQAMPGGGHLEITLHRVELDENAGQLHPDLKPGPHAKLTVWDTGVGMDPETMRHIFEPFFSTKGFGTGSGMGLAVVHRIVQDLKGAITAQSQPGKGTAVSLYLPACPTEEEAPLGTQKGELPRGSGRVMLVDDEPYLVETGGTTLSRLGYQVTALDSSLEALERFQAGPADFDLVITDFTMPNLTGVELADQMLRIRPGLPVVIVTSYSDRLDYQRVARLGVKQVLQKPLRMAALASLTKELIEEAKTASAAPQDE